MQLVAERALTLTGADGVAIAMAEGGAIVCRAAAGTIVPERGARLDPKSGFSGACLRTGGIVRCDDSEKDPRVNVQVCRLLGTRSIVAVPIASAHGTIGLLEAFSAEPHGFNDSDVRSLNLLAELILSALKPEEENRLAELSQRLVNEESVEPPSHGVQAQESPAPPPAAGEAVFAAAESGPEIFQEYGKKRKSTFSLAIVLLLRGFGPDLGSGSVVDVPPLRPRRNHRRQRRLPQFRRICRSHLSPRRRYRWRKTKRLRARTTSILDRPW